jgi:hypothetical protein
MIALKMPPKVIFSFIVFTAFTNLSILLFEIGAIAIWSSSSHPANILGPIGLFLHYFGCLLLFIASGKSTEGSDEIVGHLPRV